MGNKKNVIDTTISQVAALPESRFKRYLESLLEQERHFAEKVCKQALEVYNSQGGTAEDELRALTELVNLNERRCMHFRNRAVDMHKKTQTVDAKNGLPMPPEADFSTDIEFSYDKSTRILRVKLPVLLPFKGKWNNYIPDKVRCAVEKFGKEHHALTGEHIRFPHALLLLIHHYDDEKRVQNHYKDYDNLEWSWTLNALASTQMFSDNAACMVFMQMAAPNTESFTEVVITDADRALDILKNIDPAIDISLYNPGDCDQ